MRDNQHYAMHAVVFGVQILGENLEPKPNHEQEMHDLEIYNNSS